jgi:hypothetical protein
MRDGAYTSSRDEMADRRPAAVERPPAELLVAHFSDQRTGCLESARSLVKL